MRARSRGRCRRSPSSHHLRQPVRRAGLRIQRPPPLRAGHGAESCGSRSRGTGTSGGSAPGPVDGHLQSQRRRCHWEAHATAGGRCSTASAHDARPACATNAGGVRGVGSARLCAPAPSAEMTVRAGRGRCGGYVGPTAEPEGHPYSRHRRRIQCSRGAAQDPRRLGCGRRRGGRRRARHRRADARPRRRRAVSIDLRRLDDGTDRWLRGRRATQGLPAGVPACGLDDRSGAHDRADPSRPCSRGGLRGEAAHAYRHHRCHYQRARHSRRGKRTCPSRAASADVFASCSPRTRPTSAGSCAR